MEDFFLSDTEYLVLVGQRIKDRRIQLNISQADLANHCGVNRRTILNLEKGEPINTLTLVRVLRRLGLEENIKLLIPKESTRDPFEVEKENIRSRSSKKRT